MFEELAKQIQTTAVKLEEKIGPEVGVPWFERQMEWLGILMDGDKEAKEVLRDGFKYAEDKLTEEKQRCILN